MIFRARLAPTQAKHGERTRQVCELCGKAMKIIRREAHPARGPQHELQTFTCASCSHTQQVSVESLGAA